MSFDNSFYGYDVGYYEYKPGLWLTSKIPPNGLLSFSRRGVDAARNVSLDDSDVLVATYPKTGKFINEICGFGTLSWAFEVFNAPSHGLVQLNFPNTSDLFPNRQNSVQTVTLQIKWLHMKYNCGMRQHSNWVTITSAQIVTKVSCLGQIDADYH